MSCPCENCERKGCGAFHDRCDDFLAWKAQLEQASKNKYLYNDTWSLSREHEIRYRAIMKRRRGNA